MRWSAPLQQTQQHAQHTLTASTTCLLQVGRSLYLLGKHRAAIDVYDEALKLQADNAELWLSKGMCAVQLRDYGRCVACGN
jgi:Bardet-Biedl syndrome 4 protein